jgi:hypothetical protein
MVDLSTSWLGLALPSPLVVGASPVADDVEALSAYVEAGAGAVVVRSVFEEQIVAEQLAAHRLIDSHVDTDAEARSFLPDIDIRPLQAANVLRIEDGWHRLHGAKEVLHGVQMVAIQHPSVYGALIAIVRDRVPGTEDNILEACERDEVLDLGGPPVGALSESDGIELGRRADGLSQAAAGGFHTRNDRGRYRAKTG